MKQTGTDHQRLRSLFEEALLTGFWLGKGGAQADQDNFIIQKAITITDKMASLSEFLGIEFENGEIVSIAGKETK